MNHVINWTMLSSDYLYLVSNRKEKPNLNLIYVSQEKLYKMYAFQDFMKDKI